MLAEGIRPAVRRVIRKTVRHEKDGVNVAADIDATIVVNGGPGSVSHVRTSSRRTVVQGAAGERDQPDEAPEQSSDGPPNKEKP